MSGPRGGAPARRRYYKLALICALLLILIVTGYVVYNTSFKKVKVSAKPSFDLSSIFFQGKTLPPDPGNPCVVVQSELEATRLSLFQDAYSLLSSGLKGQVTFEQFAKNAKENMLLLRNMSAFQFPGYTITDATAAVSGYVTYRTGGRSKVEAFLQKEDGAWHISRLTLVYD